MKRLLFLTLSTLCAASFAQLPDYVPSNGLLGWWPFAGDAQDQSGNGHDGVVDRQAYPKNFGFSIPDASGLKSTDGHRMHECLRFFTLLLDLLEVTGIGVRRLFGRSRLVSLPKEFWILYFSSWVGMF